MMSDKAKLTKEQAQTIGYFKESDDWTESSLVEAHAYDITRWEDSASPINGMPLDTLIRALYIGYEVEQSPEEKLLYCYAETSSINEDFREGYRAGIEGALKILNIKIKGINE